VPQASATDESNEPPVMMPMIPVRVVVRRPSALLPRVASNEYPTRVPWVPGRTREYANRRRCSPTAPTPRRRRGRSSPTPKTQRPGSTKLRYPYPRASTPLRCVDSLRALPVELVSVGGLSNTHTRRPQCVAATLRGCPPSLAGLVAPVEYPTSTPGLVSSCTLPDQTPPAAAPSTSYASASRRH
jgi:hypothetical protein